MERNNFIENIPYRKLRLYLVYSNFLSVWPVKHYLRLMEVVPLRSSNKHFNIPSNTTVFKLKKSYMFRS